MTDLDIIQPLGPTHEESYIIIIFDIRKVSLSECSTVSWERGDSRNEEPIVSRERDNLRSEGSTASREWGNSGNRGPMMSHERGDSRSREEVKPGALALGF